jgi:hypothetical protein
MFNIFGIEVVIFMYLFACLTFMMFNLVYINLSKQKERNETRTHTRWIDEIRQQFNHVSDSGKLHPKHERNLLRKLVKIEALIDFSNALDVLVRESTEAAMEYIHASNDVFQKLARRYKSKESMEFAYFADFIYRFSSKSGDNSQLIDILISYLEDSDVYCRDNILRALNELGNLQAVEKALQIINDKGWFHHYKLITDGLAAFNGDKGELAAVLWGKYKKWNDYMMLAIVQFITEFSPNFRKAFFQVLQDSSANLEIRRAIIHYYSKYTYKQARHILTQYLSDARCTDENLAIAAASALEHYPARNTTKALINALSNSNWHVRQSAASALVALKTPVTMLSEILQGNDNNARDILLYEMEQYVYATIDDINVHDTNKSA